MKPEPLSFQQITEYRTWNDQRKACLFYIQNSSTPKMNEDMLVLIDSPIRKNDEPGEFDKLHQAELESINEEDIILKGYTVHLFVKFIKYLDGWDVDIEQEWINYYDNPYNSGVDFNLFFKKECENIGNMQVEHLFEFCNICQPRKIKDITELKRILGYFFYIPIKNWIEQINILSNFITPNIEFTEPNDNTQTFIAHYNPKKHIYTTPQNKHWNIQGFQAFLIYAGFAYQLFNELNNKINANHRSQITDGIHELGQYIWNTDKTPPINYNEYNIHSHKIKTDNIRDIYIKQEVDKIKNILKRYPSIQLLAEEEKMAYIYKKIFHKEWEKAKKSKQSLICLSKEHNNVLKSELDDFFKHILTRIKPYEKYYNECTDLMKKEEGYQNNNDQETDTITQNYTNPNFPILRNSFANNLNEVYEILTGNNFVPKMLCSKELFIKNMKGETSNQKLIWTGKKYELASFIEYAFQKIPVPAWYAAEAWICNKKDITPSSLKNIFNKSINDNSVRMWRQKFEHLSN